MLGEAEGLGVAPGEVFESAAPLELADGAALPFVELGAFGNAVSGGLAAAALPLSELEQPDSSASTGNSVTPKEERELEPDMTTREAGGLRGP